MPGRSSSGWSMFQVSGLIASRSRTPSVYCQMVASRVRKPRRGFGALGGLLLPVSLERLPEVVVEALVVGVAVLHHEGLHALRVLDGQAVAHRRAVVHNIQGVLRQPDLLGELLDHRRPDGRRCTRTGPRSASSCSRSRGSPGPPDGTRRPAPGSGCGTCASWSGSRGAGARRGRPSAPPRGRKYPGRRSSRCGRLLWLPSASLTRFRSLQSSRRSP